MARGSYRRLDKKSKMHLKKLEKKPGQKKNVTQSLAL